MFKILVSASFLFLAGGIFANSGESPSQANPISTVLAGRTCEVWMDDQRIPHLHASDELTGVACFGFVHARHRVWEMDYFRLTSQGRKSEFLGKSHITSDFILRLMDLRGKAQSLFDQMKPEDQKILWAYTLGVNRGMKQALAEGVYEFEQLGYQPAPWHPVDTLSLILLQAFDQTRRSFQAQLDQENWTKVHGTKATGLFAREGFPWDTAILKPDEYPKAQSPSPPSLKSPPAGKIEASIPAIDFSKVHQLFSEVATPQGVSAWGGSGAGSNNWVIHPKRSHTGNAWLANDPHLALTYPPIWQMSHLNAGKIDAIGYSMPGVPTIISGSNRHVSWGLTNSYLPAARLSWVSEDELTQAKTFRPLIWVKIWKFKLPFFFKSFRKTPENLPILPLPVAPGKALVLNWTGFDLQPDDLIGIREVLYATSVQDADLAFSRFGIPSWNLVFADDQGSIGYRAVGRIPRFEKAPVFGIPVKKLGAVESSFEFSHPLKPNEMPHRLNPARGFIATANNATWNTHAQFSAGNAQTSSFRAFRIEELLQKTPKHDLQSFQRIQCDLQAVDARFLVPELLKSVERKLASSPAHPQDLREAIRVLRAWDFGTQVECKACGLFRRWMNHLHEKQSLSTEALYRNLTTTPGDSLDTEILASFRLALKDLGYTPDHPLAPWGEIHRNSFTHFAGESRFFPGEGISTPGDDYSINPGTSTWTGKFFNHSEGSSERLIVEMSRPPKVYSVLAGSNDDSAHRNLNDPESEWQFWKHCRQRQRTFPVDWATLSKEVGPGKIQKTIF